MRRFSLTAFVAILSLSLLAGCGGGGGDSGTTQTAAAPTSNVNVTVNWAARTRDLDAPASALSAVFTLKLADPSGGDFSFTVNRDPAPAAYKKSYSSPRLAKLGTWDLAARFYSQPDGQGSVVGKIDAQINLTADGKGIGDFATSGTVASVAIAPNQTIPIGIPTDVLFTAKDSTGADLALTPGSAKFTVTTGSDVLTIDSQGRAVGNKSGTATVNVTVDGRVSADQQVAAGYQTSVTITPATATVFASGEIGLHVKVDGVPSLYSSAVAWSVVEGDNAGRFTNSTTDEIDYAAPTTPGTYHIVAASRFDATKRATATITVTGPDPNNQPGIYIMDGRRLIRTASMAGANWAEAPLGTGSLPISRYGFAIGPDGRLYLAYGTSVSRVDNLSGENPVTFGTFGTGAGQFRDARSVSVGSDGKIYVADQGNSRIVRFDDMTGKNWTVFDTAASPVYFGSPRVVVVGPDGKIYFTTDNYIGRVDNMNGDNGVRLNFGGAPSLSLTADGHIYFAWGNTITRVDGMDGSNAVYFYAGPGDGIGQLGGNVTVCVASNGRIYVTDPDNHRIVRMDDMTGKNWTTLGTQGVAAGEFQQPVQIVVR